MRRGPVALLALLGLVVATVLLVRRHREDDTPKEVAERSASERPGQPTLIGDRSTDASPASPKDAVPDATSAPTSRGAAGGVEGTVTLWDGRPGADLAVHLVPDGEPVPPRRKDGTIDERATPAPDRTARTDAAGRYAMPRVRPPGSWAVVVRVSRAHEARSGAFSWDASGRTQRRDVDVPAPAVLYLRVVSPDVAFVPHQVMLENDLVNFDLCTEEEEEGESRLRIEDDGRVVVPGLAEGRYRLVLVPEQGPHVKADVEVRAGESREVVLTVPTDGVVRGRVLDPMHRPLEGSAIWTGERRVHAEIDAEGRFRLVGVGGAPGELGVWTRTPEGFSFVELEEVRPDGPEVTIPLPVEARVTARVDGPKPGGTVTFATYTDGSRSRRQVPLAADRRIESTVAAGVPALLVVRADGGAPTVVDLDPLREGEERDLGVLRLDEGRTVQGRVRSVAGNDVAGAEVRVAAMWSDDFARTDAAGRFTLPLLPVRPITLRVNSDAFPPHWVGLPAWLEGEFEVVLTAGGSLAGRVVDGEERPVARAYVSVDRLAGSPAGRPRLGETHVSTMTDVEGRFLLPLSAGPYAVQALSGLRLSPAQEIRIADGESVTVRLELPR